LLNPAIIITGAKIKRKSKAGIPCKHCRRLKIVW